MRRGFGETIMSVGALAVLLLALVMFDDRVREQVWLRLSAQPAAQLTEAGAEVRNLASVIYDAARDQSIEHAPLMIFVFAATVLVMLMLRT